jgi:hypothetical protein
MPATVYDFRDLDLMLRIVHEQDDSKGVSSADLAQAIGLDDDVQAVSRRLAWMRRYGMLQFNENERLWSLSPGGERVTEARIRAAQGKALEKLPDEAMVEVMAHVTSRYLAGNPLIANLLRREFLYGTGRR